MLLPHSKDIFTTGHFLRRYGHTHTHTHKHIAILRVILYNYPLLPITYTSLIILSYITMFLHTHTHNYANYMLSILDSDCGNVQMEMSSKHALLLYYTIHIIGPINMQN